MLVCASCLRRLRNDGDGVKSGYTEILEVKRLTGGYSPYDFTVKIKESILKKRLNKMDSFFVI